MVDLCGRAEARCTDKSQRGMHDRANRGQNGIPVHGFMWKSWGRCGSLSKTRARERREGVAVTLATRRVHPSRHDLCARGVNPQEIRLTSYLVENLCLLLVKGYL